jgi:hypothetical protein
MTDRLLPAPMTRRAERLLTAPTKGAMSAIRAKLERSTQGGLTIHNKFIGKVLADVIGGAGPKKTEEHGTSSSGDLYLWFRSLPVPTYKQGTEHTAKERPLHKADELAARNQPLAFQCFGHVTLQFRICNHTQHSRNMADLNTHSRFRKLLACGLGAPRSC